MKTRKNLFTLAIICIQLSIAGSGYSQTIWDGPATTFTKPDYADWTLPIYQDKLTDDVIITRADNEGIFNIAIEENFHEYSGGGGFSYIRSTGDMTDTYWTGPDITFTKEDFVDWTLPQNQDRIAEDIWITRGNRMPIFNAAEENATDRSPVDTRWAFGSISDGIETLDFNYWDLAIERDPPSMVGENMVLYLVSDSIYIDLTFTDWSSGSEVNVSTPSDTRWAFGSIADGVENLDFDYWILTVDHNPGSMVDKNMVLFLVTDSIYIDIVFTSWSGGNSGGGFSYERSTGDISEALWTGAAITFTKNNNADWTLEENQDRITDNVWITRTNVQGIFNIAKEDSYMESYGGGGFSYERSTGDISETLWTGPKITFTKEDFADYTMPENQDRITDNVWITRDDIRGLFNIAVEPEFSRNSGLVLDAVSSPLDTRWAVGSIEDGIENLTFDHWIRTVEHPPLMVDQDMVVFLVTDSIYIDIRFTSWTSGRDIHYSSPTDTRWAIGSIADGVENLEFDYWINAVNHYPPGMVGNNMVLFLVTDSIYIDLVFTSWSGGNSGGGFSYERSTGDPSETLWTGPVITFTKDNYADWTLEGNQDRITDNVWITRADSRGLFNIAAEDAYEESRGGGGFSYERSTGDISQTLWTGPRITFTKEDFADITLEENQDRITDNVWITRADERGIFNIAQEEYFSAILPVVPSKTLWAFGSIADGVENLNFDYFLGTVDFCPPCMVGEPMVLYLIPYDIYIDITFTSWRTGYDFHAPTGTLWAFGDTDNGIENLDFDLWVNTVDWYPPGMVNKKMVLNIVADDIYIDVVFKSWTQSDQGGGFSYNRSTPAVVSDEVLRMENQFIVYPNPASDYLLFSQAFSGSSATFALYDLQGKEVMRRVLENDLRIAVDHLESGLYIYRVSTSGNAYSGKIAIE